MTLRSHRPPGYPTVVDKAMGLDAIYGDTVTTTRDDHPALASSLVRALEQLRHDYVLQLAKGVKTWDEYLKKVGIIEGLDIAIAQAKQVNDKLNA